MALTLYGRRTSLNVQKVMWTLAELGISARRINIGGEFGGLDSPDYLAKTPSGSIPVLEDGDLCLWESNSIVRHLARTYGAAPFVPSQPARAECWMDWSSLNFTSLVSEIFGWSVLSGDVEGKGKRLFELSSQMLPHTALLDRHLANHRFLLGDELTFADISVGVNLYRYFTMKFVRKDFAHLLRYYQDLQKRDSFVGSVMIDYSQMGKNGSFSKDNGSSNGGPKIEFAS